MGILPGDSFFGFDVDDIDEYLRNLGSSWILDIGNCCLRIKLE